MTVHDAHKPLLMKMGLTDTDFDLFDDKWVKYEYDEEKGVRVYDPYYATSYDEYIGIDGWSSWSVENDTFMSDVLKKTHEQMGKARADRPRANQADIKNAIEKKFSGKKASDPAQDQS